MENRRSLSQPLLSSTSTSAAPTTPTSPNLSNHAVLLRLLLVAVVGLTSLWANHEASKGFDITILNNAKGSSAGQRFDLFYVSNDEATRLLLNASNFIQNLIYPSQDLPKKIIKSVHLTLSLRDLSSNVAVEQLDGGVDFAVHLSPSIFNDTNMNHAMSTAILRGMSRVWLWNGEGHAPPSLLDGMVEHIVAAAGFVERKYSGGAVGTLAACEPMWWKDKDPMEIATFLDYHERQGEGFIQRLNQALRSRWQDRTVDNVLGLPDQRPCGSFNTSGSL
ncbi:peptidase [Cucumis melo var. makuwa]|uniref:Peptidase n=2 Tax=Cucumis melo TaxID=3656 RepID=A0A5A7V0J1_CUCMM|nr:peptidase [Cucumis melo var. makuwa]TYK21167.1 peptidase [Cucumis melo var. makuwa]